MCSRIVTVEGLIKLSPDDSNNILIGPEVIMHFLNVPNTEVLYRVNILVDLIIKHKLFFGIGSDRVHYSRHNYITMMLLLFHNTGEWPYFISVFSSSDMFSMPVGAWTPSIAEIVGSQVTVQLCSDNTHPISLFSFEFCLRSYFYFKLLGSGNQYEYSPLPRINSILRRNRV